MNRRKIFWWCYRHTTYGKIFGWVIAITSVITSIVELAGSYGVSSVGAGILLAFLFFALPVGGYFACRLLGGLHGYYTLKIHNEITHEFDEVLPRPIEIAYRMVKYGYYLPAWNEMSSIVLSNNMPGNETTKTTYAAFIDFQHDGAGYSDIRYLEKGVAMPSLLESLGADSFHYNTIISACRRMADDYEH